MCVQYPETVKDQIGWNHHYLERHDKKNQIQQKNRFFKPEIIPRKCPGGRHAYQKLSCQDAKHLQA